MQRGTRVGQAYIALTADGSGVNDDIVDSMDGIDYEEMGDQAGQNYRRGLDAHLDAMESDFRDMARRANEAFDADNDMSASIQRRLRTAFNDGDLDALMREVGGRTGTEFTDAFDEQMRHSIMDSVERNMRDAARRGTLSTSDMFSSLGQDEDGGGGFSIPGPMLARITDQAEAEYRRQIAELERRVQSDREAVWRMGFDRHEEYEREFTALLEEEERHRLAIEERTQSDREAIWRMGFDRDAERQRQSEEAYAALMRREEDNLQRSLAERAQMEDDDSRRRNRERIRYEQEFARLLEEQDRERIVSENRRAEQEARDARQRDDDRFRHFTQRAHEAFSELGSLRFDPRIDGDRLEEQMQVIIRRLQVDLESRDDLTLALNADLPLRERAKIEAQIQAIDSRIRVTLDEDELNRTLLRGQGIIDRQSNVGGGGDSALSQRITRMFGGGSRNNFLNILGKSMGSATRLVQKFGDVGEKVFGSIATRMAESGAMGGRFAAVLGRMGPMLGTVVGSGVGLLALVAVMSLLVSAAGALLAIMTALVSTIASGLVGAVLVGAAAFSALAAAAGLATIAFTSMTDAQREMMADAFRPIKEELTGIGQMILTPMMEQFGRWSRNIQNALLPLAGIAHVVGVAFGQAGNIITKSFSGPGFTAFIQSLGTYLPSIITKLSGALGGFLNGAMGLFAILMPYVNRFAGYLKAVGDRFSNFVNSPEGNNKIVSFVDRAVNSLISLWNATKQVMGFITDLIFSPEAQQAGMTIFDGIMNTFIGLRRWLRQAAASGDLKRWFDDGIQFGAALWNVLKSLGKMMMSLYDSGVIDAMSGGMNAMAQVFDVLTMILGPVVDLLGYALPIALAASLAPLMLLASALIGVGEIIEGVGGLINKLTPGDWGGDGAEFSQMMGPLNVIKDLAMSPFTRNPESAAQTVSNPAGSSLPDFQPGNFSLSDVIGVGHSALGATSEDHGGYLSDEWKNPYVKYAESLMQQGPTIARQIKKAMKEIDKAVAAAIRDAASAANAGEAKSALQGAIDSMRSNIAGIVDSARAGLDSAASSLANASSQKEANKALKEVKKAQAALNNALAAQKRTQDAARILAAQKVVNWDRVRQLQYGVKVEGATLADFAAARERMAARIEKANEALTEAIALRDDYRKSVTDATKEFGNLMTAQAQTINGVQQAITAQDITSNLQDRLAKIRKFQADLRVLLSMGLSNDAYKQLVDGGVETGGAYAAALVEGGQGAVVQVNGLTASISSAAEQLGMAASNRMYQAGVDSARGLVEGLESMSGRLDEAAERLGNRIARAIRKALKIKSPSQVLIDMMDPVGDGAVIGLDNQGNKIDAAAARFAGRIAVSPEVAEYDAKMRAAAGVSENPAGGGDEHHWHITTPTEDPEAVAREAINEMTGRLG